MGGDSKGRRVKVGGLQMGSIFHSRSLITEVQYPFMEEG